MSKKQDSLHRIDLTKEYQLELEELKSSITDSLESAFITLESFSPTSTAKSSLPSSMLASVMYHKVHP